MRVAFRRLLVALPLLFAVAWLPACFLDTGYGTSTSGESQIRISPFNFGGNGGGYESSVPAPFLRWGTDGESSFMYAGTACESSQGQSELVQSPTVGYIKVCSDTIYRPYMYRTADDQEAFMRLNYTALWCRLVVDPSTDIFAHVDNGQPIIEVREEGNFGSALSVTSYTRGEDNSLSLSSASLSLGTEGSSSNIGTVNGSVQLEPEGDALDVNCWLNIPLEP